MTDLALSWNGREADLVIEDGDFALDDSLQTPVIISLFSDRRARPDDAWPDVPADLIGSRLWLLRREKEIAETLRRAREYGKESVAWTLDDGIAAKVEVTASVPKDPLK
ncbi:phage GP46 family protein [Pseudomonas anguilliseptica]|uniref:phage GP46 family protein n=1 Tax=Pseudomonas anguilliseptica TaxID=53406 RepID=UPI00325C00C2